MARRPKPSRSKVLDSLTIEKTVLSGPTITLPGPDAAMRTSTMKIEGEYQGKPLVERVYKVQIMVKQNGKWLEKFFQSTILDE